MNETIVNVWSTAQSYVYNIVGGILILLVGFILGLFIKKILCKILREVNLNKTMNTIGIMVNVEKWVSNIISFIIYLVTVVYFLSYLGITSIVLYLLVGAILMLLILTLLVGLRDVLPNFIGWLFLQKKKKIKEGHKINLREIAGIVEKIGYLETEIRTEQGDLLYVPNSLFLKSKFQLKKE